MEALLGLIGLVGMVGNTISAGKQAADNIPNIQKNTKKVLSNIDNLNQKINEMEMKNEQDVEEMDEAMQDIIQQNQQLFAEIQLERKASLAKIKTIQIGGIIFIVVIFFLLLMKRFGITQSINNILMAPFRKKQN